MSHLSIALATMRIEPPGAALSFSQRLARANGWSSDHAEAVVAEYRRFLYLARIADRPVTPSDDVDQAWHLHLTYTRHYWDELCGRILGMKLHHDPTEGGPAQGARFRRQYEATLALYRRTFGAMPPPAIWPSSERRFGARHVRVDRNGYWLLPRGPIRPAAALAGTTGLLAACTALAANGGGGGGARIAVIAVVLLIGLFGTLAAILAFGFRHPARRDPHGGCGGAYGGDCGDGGCSGGGGCGGGCGG